MKPETATILKAALRADGTISDEQASQALITLNGKRKSETTENLPLLLTQGQTARQLNVSRYTVWRLERAGKLKAIYITPDLKRWRRADVEALAAGGVVP